MLIPERWVFYTIWLPPKAGIGSSKRTMEAMESDMWQLSSQCKSRISKFRIVLCLLTRKWVTLYGLRDLVQRDPIAKCLFKQSSLHTRRTRMCKMVWPYTLGPLQKHRLYLHTACCQTACFQPWHSVYNQQIALIRIMLTEIDRVLESYLRVLSFGIVVCDRARWISGVLQIHVLFGHYF